VVQCWVNTGSRTGWRNAAHVYMWLYLQIYTDIHLLRNSSGRVGNMCHWSLPTSRSWQKSVGMLGYMVSAIAYLVFCRSLNMCGMVAIVQSAPQAFVAFSRIKSPVFPVCCYVVRTAISTPCYWIISQLYSGWIKLWIWRSSQYTYEDVSVGNLAIVMEMPLYISLQ
jgi:hypothetical protein